MRATGAVAAGTEAALTGLQENTRYYYRIGSEPNATFRTPVPRGSSDFWFAEEADVDVQRGGPCPVALDRALMRHILANLARNAIDASRPARARVHLGVALAPGRAVLTVGDEGPGIAPELRERVFDPYFTTRHEGTGLGLAIVKKIVVEHGGTIGCDASPTGGAGFRILLPQGRTSGGPSRPDSQIPHSPVA